MSPDASPGDPVLRQLRTITRVLTLAHAGAIERELSKVASTDVRKRAWVLIDGTRNASEIARLLSQSPRTIQAFIATASSAGFVDAQAGKPVTRLIDYVPPAWLDLAGEPGSTPQAVEPESATSPAGPVQHRLGEDKSPGEGS